MRVQIYQIANIATTPYAFRDFDEKKFDLKHYNKVYDQQMNFKEASEVELLEDLYAFFNTLDQKQRDEINFTGVSISTSDVIMLDDRSFYCQMVGWKKL